MITPLDPREVERFRSLLARHLGLHFEDSKLAELEDRLRHRLEARSQTSEAYFDAFERPETATAELRALARALTVPETYFFRNIAQFHAFAEVALPARMRASARRHVSLLSAGCASGEEPYSLAMVAAERLDPSWSVSIRAVDLNPAALEKAAQARYSPWALRETPPEVQRRFFTALGPDFVLHEGVRSAVTFEERNLALADRELWSPNTYDVIFCRNVLMYFTPQSAVSLVERIATALAPGGYLFLGHAETLRGLSSAFHLRHTHGTFYYQRRGSEAAREAAGSAGAFPGLAPELAALPVPPSIGDGWVEAIRRASDRIQELAERPALVNPHALRDGGLASHPREVGRALELLQTERYAEALEAVHALPPDSAGDPDVLLLQATLLTHSGRLGEAERACRRLLATDEMNAGAHYLLALCHEGGGDLQAASSHDQVAAYLDPGFAMPRLHLGLLARRAGDPEAARRELTEASDLLRREDSSRLLLFGGGFSRDALIAVCRAELARCGTRS